VEDTADAGPVEDNSRTMPNQFYWSRRSDDNDADSVNLIMASRGIALMRDHE